MLHDRMIYLIVSMIYKGDKGRKREFIRSSIRRFPPPPPPPLSFLLFFLYIFYILFSSREEGNLREGRKRGEEKREASI